MKTLDFLAAVCCMAAVFTAMSITFVSCKKEKTDDPKDPSTEQNGGNQNEDETPDPVTYTLTVLSSNEEMGTVTGGGSYEEGTEVTLTATPTSDGYAFMKWSDENTDNPRALTVAEDLELTAIFDYAVVDLGLPSGLKWAACNVGATSPEEYGNYYAWGETEPKTTYNWSTYKWCNGSYNTQNKYCTSSTYGTVDNKTVLELADDAARANWDGQWRMPTDAEWTELRENCELTWTDDYNGTGVNGRIVTSNINGNFIFLPAAGYRYDGVLSGAGIYGYYWSSSLCDYPDSAWGVYFFSGYVDRDYSRRYYGQSVRPVLK